MEKRNYSLDLMKCLAIFTVLAIHIGLYHDDFSSSMRITQIIQYALRLLSEGVPIFVAVNGFLMLKKDKLDLKKHLVKTAKLLALIIVWAVILVLVANPKDLTFKSLFLYILNTKNGAKYTGVLWFLQSLIAVYIIFPLLHKVYKDDFRIFKYLFAVLTVFVPLVDTLELVRDTLPSVEIFNAFLTFVSKYNPFSNLWFLYYFCLGGMIFRYYEKVKSHRVLLSALGGVGWLCAVCYGVLMTVFKGSLYPDSFNYGSIFEIFIVIGLFALTADFNGERSFVSKFITSVGQNTMGIYLSHMGFLAVFSRLYHADRLPSRLVLYAMTFVASYLFSLLVGKTKYLKAIIGK